MNNIKISIITVVFNSASTIKTCIESVLSQNISVEYIIIDGGSIDGTLDVIKEYHNELAFFISEKDDGMYDALNKGLKVATGEVIGFLHADDFYSQSDTLLKISDVFKNFQVDSCYGDLIYVEPNNIDNAVRCWYAGSYDVKKFLWGWMPPHPTFFVRKRVYEKYGFFRLDMGTAADYELMLRFLLKHKVSSVYIPEIIVKMRSGGMSNVSLKNRLKANLKDRMAWQVNGLKPNFWTLSLKPFSKIKQYFQKPF